MKSAGAIDAMVGMRAEVVTKALDEVGWSALAPVAVVVSKRRREGRNRDALVDRGFDDPPPRRLSFGQRVLEEGVEHQARQARVFLERVLDHAEEPGADDAAAAPDRR